MADNKNGNSLPGGAPPLDDEKKEKLAEKSAKDKKTLTVIIACVLLVIIALIVIIIGMSGSKSKKGAQGSTTAPGESSQTLLTGEVLSQGTADSVSESISQSSSQTAEPAQTAEPETTVPAAEVSQTQVPQTQNGLTQNIQTTETFTIEELEPLTKTGDNILSDSKNNEFIKIVSEKYGISTDRLVAIYAVPDKGNNFVLEFSGKTDADGNIIKSPDTLYRVHLVDLDRNVKTATGKLTGNKGVSYAEGLLTMEMMKGIIMPQHPDYFTGVEKK